MNSPEPHRAGIALVLKKALDILDEIDSYYGWDERDILTLDKALKLYDEAYEECVNPTLPIPAPPKYYLVLYSNNQGLRTSCGFETKAQAMRYKNGELRQCAKTEPILGYDNALIELKKYKKRKNL